jgi:hypothetical protein
MYTTRHPVGYSELSINDGVRRQALALIAKSDDHGSAAVSVS